MHKRLVDQHGFTGSYQRVEMILAETRPRIAAELAEADENPLTGLHRRLEAVPGAQAQVDWCDEGDLLGHVGIRSVYSFHMTLSHSRDPFTCFTTSMDSATFWESPSGVCRLRRVRTALACRLTRLSRRGRGDTPGPLRSLRSTHWVCPI